MKKTTFLLLAFIGLCSFQVNAQTVVTFLQDAPNGEWQTTTNWDTGSLPGTTDQAFISYAGDLTLDQSRTIGNLKFSTNTSRSFLDAGSTILTLDTPFAANSRLIDNTAARAITIYPSINFTASGVIYNRNKANNELTFTGGTIYINSNTITIDSRSTNLSNQYIVFNGPVEGNGIINVDDSQNTNATKGISLGADANFSTFTGTINAKNNPVVSSTTNAFGSALTLDGTASFEINVASTFTGSISRLATTAGAATVTFNANQSMGALTVDTNNLAIDFDAAATDVRFSGYTISGTEGVVDLQNYVSGSLKIGTDNTGISQAILDTWLLSGVEPADGTITQDTDGSILSAAPAVTSFTTTADGTWEDGATWVGGVAPSTATDNIIINHNITINSDVVVNDFSIINMGTNTERVTVEAGYSLTINGDADTKHQLFAESTSTSFASLIFSTTGSTSKNIGYRRYINSHANGNDLISSPVPDTFSQIQGSFYANPADATQILFGPFDNTAGTFTNWDTDDLNGNNGNLVVGKGYRAATDAGSKVEFKDAITSPVADIPVSITDGGDATYGEWNLIGNPYPSYLDFETFFDANSGEFHLDNVAVYGWNGTGYTIWNNANDTDKLAPTQGFFVRTKDGVTGTVTFTPAMRTTGNSNDFVLKSANNKKALAKINLSSTAKTFSTNIYFIENQTRGLDFGYDAGAFSGSEKGIYTNLVEDNKGLALGIQALPYDDYNSVVVPVAINSEAGAELTISLDVASLTLPTDTYVYLKDNVLNTTTLLNDTDYVFTPDSELSGSGRFFIEFSAKAVLATDEFAVNEMLIYTNQESKSIIIKGILKTDASAKVFDIQGRMVLEQKLNSSNLTNVVNANTLNTGVYMIQLEGRTQKVILN